tara:strand:- start:1193 stop:1822 length:630 start_codon:yes stop_codon:yes gene_type:complete
MRQHVNPLSKYFDEIEIIPHLNEIFEDSRLPLHVDIGSAAGDFLFDLASENTNWNYLGIEIREKLANHSKLRLKDFSMNNLYFAFGNANNIFSNPDYQFITNYMASISFNFPDPWFKKKHYKRRVIQPDLINFLSNSMKKGSLIFIKTDIKELFDFMHLIISNNVNFIKLDYKKFSPSESFNPNQIKTTREKYVISSKTYIFENIYIKI